MKNQNGFTLIELVIVIVLLGVLSAIAVPRFVNLEDDAQEAALNATATAVTSAMNINYAECAVNNHSLTDPVSGAATQCVTVNSCGDATAVINGGSLAPFEVVADTTITGAVGTALSSCSVRRVGTTTPTRNFTAVRAGP